MEPHPRTTTPRCRDSGTRRFWIVWIAAAVGSVMAACGLAIPSGDLPQVEQRWVVTALETSIGVGELINPQQAPATQQVVAARVQQNSNGGAPGCSPSSVRARIGFENEQVVVSDGGVTLECSLRDLCRSCRPGRQSKPAFSLRQEENIPLPDRDDLTVKSVSVTGGSVVVSLRHDLGLVLLRPGELDVEVWSRGDDETDPVKLREFSLDRDLAGSTPITYAHDFSRDPATIVGGIRLVVAVDAPADPGSIVDIDLSETMQAEITVNELTVSAAGVVIDKELELDPEPLTVDEDTVSEIVDRVRGRVAITVAFTNPFPIAVQGTFDLGDAVALTDEQKSISVRPGTAEEPVTTTKEVTLTRAQLRAFLERGIFSFGGRVSTDDVVTLHTDKEIRVTISVDVSLVTEPEEA